MLTGLAIEDCHCRALSISELSKGTGNIHLRVSLIICMCIKEREKMMYVP